MLFDKTKYQGKELFNFLVENKGTLIAQKKAELKKADGISVLSLPGVNVTSKAIDTDKKEISVKAVINTTNVIDSHDDLHIPGLWDKSIKENKRIMHLQEHEMKFSSIISDGEDLNAYTQTYSFKDLGYDLPGQTEALVFDSNVKASRNTYMFNEYKSGHVSNHSVGMVYVKIALAVNDKDYKEEFAAWEKYSPMVANVDKLEQGYFWAVTEAKAIEGSAVPMGSNSITPTLEVKNEPPKGTQHKEPPKGTQIDYQKLINHLKTVQ